MSDRFLKRIDKLLEESNNMSLKILLEEEESDPFADAFGDEGDKGDGDEGGEDEEGGTPSVGGEEGDTEADVEGEEGDEGVEGEEGEKDSVKKSAIDTLADLSQNMKQVNIIDNETSKILSKYKLNPQNKIKLSSSKTIKYDSIKSFVMLEKEEREDIQTIISDYQDKIEDMEIDSYKGLKNKQAGTLIDISAEVSNAVQQVKYFDKFFKKSEIVHDWFIDLIGKTAPADKKEEMIKQFKDEFDRKLSPEDKINIQDKPASYNAMAGAKPTA